MGNGCSISTITIDEKGYLFAPPPWLLFGN